MELPVKSGVFMRAERLPRVDRVAKKNSVLRELKVHSRRIGVILLNVLFGHVWIYFLVGFANKYLCGKPIKTMFMLYPANEKYTKAYVYSWYARSMKWSPRLVGILRQNGKWGLIFGISATEDDFIKPENTGNLKKVERELDRIKNLLGADQKTFAGILPGVLFSKGIVASPVERGITVRAILQALDKVRLAENLSALTPIILLGGKGFISSALREAGNGNLFSFDIGEEDLFLSFSKELKGKPAILLNITRKNVLLAYVPHLWPEVVVVNEVYPEPSEKELAEIRAMKATCYHIVGVRGKALPGFPRGYEGGIPCCASFWPQDGRGYDVLVKKL